jgi:pyruvate dehydrogenase (quinone)
VLEQKSIGFLPTGTDLVNPNFARMAEAIGIKGVRIEGPNDLDERVAEALAHPGPVVVDASSIARRLAMPPAITVETAKGFTLYMLKAILSGRGDEIVDLARRNLRR